MPRTMKLYDGAISYVYYAAHQASLHGDTKVDQVGIRQLGACWII
jgi:hypothetical protein